MSRKGVASHVTRELALRWAVQPVTLLPSTKAERLGHVHVNESYWYLEAVPELLSLATERLRRAKQVRP